MLPLVSFSSAPLTCSTERLGTWYIFLLVSIFFSYFLSTQAVGHANILPGLFNNDPIFPDSTCKADDLLCNFSWAVMLQGTANLTIAGAGLYSWYVHRVPSHWFTPVVERSSGQRFPRD